MSTPIITLIYLMVVFTVPSLCAKANTTDNTINIFHTNTTAFELARKPRRQNVGDMQAPVGLSGGTYPNRSGDRGDDSHLGVRRTRSSKTAKCPSGFTLKGEVCFRKMFSHQVLRPGMRGALIKCDVRPSPPTLRLKWRLPNGNIWTNLECKDGTWTTAECTNSRWKGHCYRPNVNQCDKTCDRCDRIQKFEHQSDRLSVALVTKETAGVYTCIAEHLGQKSEFKITLDVRYNYEDADTHGCPPSILPTDGEWTFSRENSKCYGTDKPKTALNFGAAEIWCRERGAHLAMPKTSQDISQLRDASNDITKLWVGIDSIGRKRDWRWVDGSRVQRPGSISTIKSGDTPVACVTLDLSSGTFHTEQCLKTRNFLCETSTLYWKTFQRQIPRCPVGLINFECGGICYWLSDWTVKKWGLEGVVKGFPWKNAKIASVDTPRKRRAVALLLIAKYKKRGHNLVVYGDRPCKTLNYRGELAKGDGHCDSAAGNIFAVQTRYTFSPPCRAKWLAGDLSNIEVVPWMAMVFFGSDGTSLDWHKRPCTATIIGSKWLITSAHCMVQVGGSLKPFSSMFVMSGNSHIRDGIRAAVKNVTLHPGYYHRSWDVKSKQAKDLAILEVEASGMSVCPATTPICLKSKDIHFKQCFLTGFGNANNPIVAGNDDKVTACRIKTPKKIGNGFKLSSGCHTGYTSIDNTCYMLYRGKAGNIRSHDRASNLCARTGGFLAEARTQEEYDGLLRYLTVLGHAMGYNNTWRAPVFHIGATFEGRWLWNFDDKPVEFFHWAPGEPNLLNEDENCLVFDHSRSGFAQTHCDKIHQFMCQMKAKDDDSFSECPKGTWRDGSPLVCKDAKQNVQLVGLSLGYHDLTRLKPSSINVVDVSPHMAWIRDTVKDPEQKDSEFVSSGCSSCMPTTTVISHLVMSTVVLVLMVWQIDNA